jgi:hypothetical protein
MVSEFIPVQERVSMPRFVWVGTAGRRLDLFAEVLARRGLAAPVVVPFDELLDGRLRLPSVIREGDLVRIESPGKDFEVERALLKAGIGAGHELSTSSREGFRIPLSLEDVERLEFDRGLILPQSQWFHGWCRVLSLIAEQLADCAPHTVMNAPAEIATLFDKIRCHELFYKNGLPTPAWLGRLSSFEELNALMEEHRCSRVFIKPAHSSNASGMVAYQRSKGRHVATTTVETVERDGTARLYNSRRIRRITEFEKIKTLIDRLAVHNLFAEKWFPKAGLGGKTFDLRVVVIGGKSRHVVVRESKTPFTNLHLLNGRGQLSAVKKALGQRRFGDVLSSCERAAGLFPGCLYLGVDVLVSSDFRSHVISEVNAFGDLLPGILHEGLNTYEWELNQCEGAKERSAIDA